MLAGRLLGCEPRDARSQVDAYPCWRVSLVDVLKRRGLGP
jgi:hypothetical protein